MGEPLREAGVGRRVWESCTSLLGKQNSVGGKWVSTGWLVPTESVSSFPTTVGVGSLPCLVPVSVWRPGTKGGAHQVLTREDCTIMNAHLRKRPSPRHPELPSEASCTQLCYEIRLTE